MPLNEYFTVKEVAEVLDLKPSTINARIRRGKIQAEKKGWNTFISKEELERLKTDANTKNMEKSAR